MTPDVLDPSALLQSLPARLPQGSRSLQSQNDAISALLHTSLFVLGFRLIAVSLFSLLALGEPQYNYPVPGPAPTPTPPATSDGSSLAGSTMDVSSNFYGMHDHLHTLSVPDHGSSWWCINV